MHNGDPLGQATVILTPQQTTLTIFWLREVPPSEQGDIVAFLLKLFPVVSAPLIQEHDRLALETGYLYSFILRPSVASDVYRVVDIYESPDGPIPPQ